MAEYITVTMDDYWRNEWNRGLRHTIEYIGFREYPGKIKDNDRTKAYKLGKKFINSKMTNKWNMTAINRLVEAERIMLQCDYGDVRYKYQWKIHRRKAEKIFNQIAHILERYVNTEGIDEIIVEFNKIRSEFFRARHNVRGAEVISSPYYGKIFNDDRLRADNNLSNQDIKDLRSLRVEMLKFDKY